MGHLDPNFLGQLKTTWNLHFSHNRDLILALSGSMSAWIEKNILSSAGFLGRESLTLKLRELPLAACKKFWTSGGSNVTTYEMLRFLALTGGVPRYLEELNPTLSAKENIKRLAFDESGILFNEFEKIFSDLFSSRNELYKKIIIVLAAGAKTQQAIATQLQYRSSSEMSGYLTELEKSDFISRDFTWRLATAKPSNLSYYRLSDNYARFYLKYILPNKTKIIKHTFQATSIAFLPGWSTIMGLQVENLVLNNHARIKSLLSIMPTDVEADGSFFQRQSQCQASCQIDYMIQTNARTLYVCEVKFSRYQIGMQIVSEVEQKLARLKTPKQFFCRSVLIHVNGVTDEVQDSGYFSHIIDLAVLFD